MEQSLISFDLIESIGLGLGLGIAAGFRVVVPFWVLSLAAFFGHLPLQENMQWLGSETALIGLSIALVVELLAYSIPWLDNVVDTIALPIAAIAGTLLMALAVNHLDPFAQWSLAILAGGGAAATVKGLSGFTRLISTTSTVGLANFVVAIAELIGAIALSVLALTAPLLAVVGIVLLFVLMARFATKAFKPSQEISAEVD